jgi:hypothetical protein
MIPRSTTFRWYRIDLAQSAGKHSAAKLLTRDVARHIAESIGHKDATCDGKAGRAPPSLRMAHMLAAPFVALLALIGIIAIVVWIVQWASDYRRSRTALDSLNERLARGEIDHAEYEAKRSLISRRNE